MRAGGINWTAALVAAIAIYAIGYIIYGVLIDPDLWMAAQGLTAAEMETTGMARMAFSPLMPLATAFGMAVLFKWGNVQGLADGAKWGALIALASAIPATWYGWVYGVGPAWLTLLDSSHLLLGHAAAGAILGRWK
jgi:hypothetical protein